MSFASRVSLCLLALNLIFSPALAQTQSVPNPPTSSEVNDLAAALIAAASEEEQERLLALKKDLVNSSLLAVLKTLANPLVQKGDYAHNSMGRYELSLELLQKSRAISEELNDKATLDLALNNIAINYISYGRYAEALECLQRSLKIMEEMGWTDDKRSNAIRLLNIGLVYRRQGNTDQALAHYRKSLKLMEEIDDKLGIANLQNNIGVVYKSQGLYEQAMEWFQKSLKLYEEIPFRAGVARSLNNIGDAYRLHGRYDRALEHLRRSLRLREENNDRLGISLTLNNLGQLYQDQGKFAEMLEVSRRAASLAEEINAPEELWKAHDRIGRVFHALGQPDRARVSALKAGVEKARLEYEALETSLYVAHPELKVHRGEASIIKAEDLTALLPDHTSAMLEYVVADDQTYLFAITKVAGQAEAKVQVYTIPIKRAELAKQTESFRAQLAGRDLGFRASAHKLHDLLLKPAQALLRGKSNLVIVPDDQLWELPFQALLTRDGRYVIERSAVSYVPSLTVLREMKAQSGKHRAGRRADTAGYSLLALGNPAIGKETIERAALALRDEKLDPLPEAEQEVKALGQLYGGARSKVYIGAEAREDRLKAEAAQARVLHFATHGILNNASPMYSHLALAQGDKSEDGLLEAWELMQMDLRADLAVLSACETARGRVGAGEGMIGLSWALFVAGAPAIVVSQWKVESAATRDLMVAFHRQLRPGATQTTKAAALRQAALKLMKNPETSHPFYWAGFVLVGDGK